MGDLGGDVDGEAGDFGEMGVDPREAEEFGDAGIDPREDGEFGEVGIDPREDGEFGDVGADPREGLPGQPAQEEMSAGAMWAVILAVGFAVWWFTRSRGGGGGGSRAGGAAGGQAAGDAEAMRKRRLEAALARGGGGASGGQADSDEGLRQRKTASAANADGEADASKPSESTEAADGQGTAASKSAEEKPVPKKAPAPAAQPPSFSVQARGILRGVSSVHKISGLRGDMSVADLQDRVIAAFGPGAADAKLRLHANGQELSKPDRLLEAAKIVADTTVQIMFVTKPGTVSAPPKESIAAAPAAPAAPPAAVPAPAPAAAPAAPPAAAPVRPTAGAPAAAGSSASSAGELSPGASAVRKAQQGGTGSMSIRVQGSHNGFSAHTISDLDGTTTVRELEDLIRAAFEATSDVGIRLFFMGKELKDPASALGAAGIKSGVTLNVLFAAGKLGPPAAAQQPAAASPAAAVAGATPAAAAAPQVAVPAGGGGSGSGGGGGSLSDAAALAAAMTTPEEAWKAMAAVEDQLSYAEDSSAQEPVRQAAVMLKQMLLTCTHEDNPALLQFAQMANPDLVKIWALEETRERLLKLLASSAPSSTESAPGAGSSGS